MPKKIIHFAHANGFPARTYSKLFSFLEDEYEVNFLERHAHNPKFPVTDGWERLRDELLEELEKRYTDKIIGIGHSLGGVLHFLAAVEKPEIYHAVVLLDAPIISRLSSNAVRMLKILNLSDRFTPSQVTRFRRNLWTSKQEVFEHFKEKEKFAAFDEDVLRDYAEHATVETNRGFELYFKPSIEAKIYRSLPHNLPKFRGRLKVPAAYIGGTDSNEAKMARLGFMKKYFPFEFYFLEGSHLFPLEKPQKTAAQIKETLRHLLKQ